MRYLFSMWIIVVSMFLTPPALPAAEPNSVATLEVTGHGAVAERPDEAVLTFTVETSATDADEAIRQNAAKAEKLIAKLKQKMASQDRLTTTRFQLHPVYEKNQRISPSSFRVSNTVKLETVQVDNLGLLIDTAADAGSNRIGQLRFRHSRSEALARQAAVLAVQQARRIAEDLARAAGVTITRVQRISYGSHPSPGPMRAEMAMARSATPIEVGALSIERQVLVVFAIE